MLETIGLITLLLLGPVASMFALWNLPPKFFIDFDDKFWFESDLELFVTKTSFSEVYQIGAKVGKWTYCYTSNSELSLTQALNVIKSTNKHMNITIKYT